MSDPRWTVTKDGNPLWGQDTWVITLEDLAYQLWTGLDVDDVEVAHKALVECVRSHDTLTRARQLARTVVDGREGGFSTREFAFKAELALLDLLTGEGQ